MNCNVKETLWRL